MESKPAQLDIHPGHAFATERFQKLIASYGYESWPGWQPYHELLKNDLAAKQKMINVKTMTSLLLRTSADECFVGNDKSLLAEYKSCTGGYTNLAIELVPALRNKRDCENGLAVAYFISHWHPDIGDRAFWASELPKPKTLFLCDGKINQNIRRIIYKMLVELGWDDCELREYRSNGSNDPFLLISHEDLKKMKRPEELLAEFNGHVGCAA